MRPDWAARTSGAGVAQDFYTVKVAGSNPASSTFHDQFHAALAQLVEHSTEN